MPTNLNAFHAHNHPLNILKKWKNVSSHATSDMHVYKKQICNPKKVQTFYDKMDKARLSKICWNVLQEIHYPLPRKTTGTWDIQSRAKAWSIIVSKHHQGII